MLPVIVYYAVQMAGSKGMPLNSGEELLLTDHEPDDYDIQPVDGLGRRNTRKFLVGHKHVAISDFSIMSLISNHESLLVLRSSSVSSERRLIDRMLKTAATVDVVLRYRGAYKAR